ncbi:MAG: hypothetical protein NUV59_01105 [Patescibacteria group bacterium]|nr:hypothetical protein [Patescibacteria group bacterium]
MYKRALMSSGLDEKQAGVYIACLELGPAKVPAIARQAQIKRTTTYGVVDELVSMGLIVSSYKGKTKLYRAVNPEVVLSLQEDKKRKVEEALPGLSELFLTRHARPKITFFEGRDGIKKIYGDILECKSKQVRQIVRVKDHIAAVGDAFIKDYIKKRVARGITARDLHPVSGDIYTQERGMENPKLKRCVRYLPPHVFHAAMIMIYDHKVAMVSTKEENFGFIIESKQFSNTLSAYFDFMWGLGSRNPET